MKMKKRRSAMPMRTTSFFFVPVVAAVIALGMACSSSEDASTASGTAPFAPTRLAIAQMDPGLHITWKDNSSDEDEFEIERKEEGGAYGKIASVTFDVSQYHDTAVSAGRAYTYRVRATNAARKSPYSNEATAKAPTSATGGGGGGGTNAGSGVGWDGGTVSFTQHIIPLFEKSCGTAKTGCHVREAYGASKDSACRGWLTLENASLGAKFYGGSNDGQATGCPDRSLYARLIELDAWQEPNGKLRKYVKPNDPPGSYLFNKIAGGPFGEDRPGVASEPMPMNGALSAEDVAMVKKWIESGAPQN
jgi:hypothetical protein